MHTFVLLFSVLAGSSSGPAAVPQAKDGGAALLGCWSLIIDLPFPIPDRDARACFKRSSKGAVAGRVLIDDAWVQMQDVDVDGVKFRFRVRKDDENVVFRGEVNQGGKAMGGSVKRGDMKRPFTGIKD